MSSVDWTGVAPSDAPIEALTEEVFVRRLEQLSQRTRELSILRAALHEQAGMTDDERISPGTFAAP